MHFSSDCYINRLQFEQGHANLRLLSNIAIPTIHPPAIEPLPPNKRKKTCTQSRPTSTPTLAENQQRKYGAKRKRDIHEVSV